MTPATTARPLRWLGATALLALLSCGVARAAEPVEFWPELNLFETLGPTTRLYFVAATGAGRESPLKTLDVAAYFDLTLRPRPLFRQSLQEEDWRRNRYLWLRVGYDHTFRLESETGTLTAPEDKGIVALSARAYLPEAIVFEGRARADLRWIEGDYSTRYRLRGELNRDFNVAGHVVTPWLQAEVFYDTRYDGWARHLYQAGAEIAVTPRFRLEPSLARQVDLLPTYSGLWAFAFVARWYY